MTGDGVNDVLALREADCGIAMASGSQAASQVAQLVLLQSDFAAMQGVVGEGPTGHQQHSKGGGSLPGKKHLLYASGPDLHVCHLPIPGHAPAPEYDQRTHHWRPLVLPGPGGNRERIKGRFMAGVLRKAFPGGLTNLIVVLMAVGFVLVFHLPTDQLYTVSASLMCLTGLFGPVPGLQALHHPAEGPLGPDGRRLRLLLLLPGVRV